MMCAVDPGSEESCVESMTGLLEDRPDQQQCALVVQQKSRSKREFEIRVGRLRGGESDPTNSARSVLC